jgi:DNA repair protein RecO (recombination protein O)
VRKPRSRKAGHLEPFTRANLLLARGRDLPIITQAEAIDMYMPLREDLLRTTYAAYLIELVDRFMRDEEESRDLYRLLSRSLERLCRSNEPEIVLRYFEIRLLDLVGFRPQLFQCSLCAREIQAEDQYFSATQGGVLCPRCGPQVSGSRPISMLSLKYLRHFQRSSFNEARRARPSAAHQREIESIVQHYLIYLLERNLNTTAFIHRVRKIAHGEPFEDENPLGEEIEAR